MVIDDHGSRQVLDPPGPTMLHFVRHGHVHNPHDVYYGRLPGYPLSGAGARQALALAEELRNVPIAAIYSSPLLRALQTAESIAGFHPELTLRVSPLLNEVRSHFDGCPRKIVAAMKWWVYSEAGPDDEQPIDLLTRARTFVAEARQEFAGKQVVVVTHGDVIAFFRLWLDNPDKPLAEVLTAECKAELYKHGLATCSITTLTYRGLDPDEMPSIEYTPSLFAIV